MEKEDKLKSIIEALLIVSDSGLTKQQLKEAITDSDGKDINESIRLLKEEYETSNRAFTIAEIAGHFRIVTKPEFMPWINNLYQKDVDRLTGPSLETLAIIAYKQPATRAEIEAVRGVNVGGVIKTLLDKNLISVRGRKNVIGRPLMYGTTPKFLEIFGLNSLEDLPALRDFTEEDLEYGKPKEVVEVENAEEPSEAKEAENSPKEEEVVKETEKVKDSLGEPTNLDEEPGEGAADQTENAEDQNSGERKQEASEIEEEETSNETEKLN